MYSKSASGLEARRLEDIWSHCLCRHGQRIKFLVALVRTAGPNLRAEQCTSPSPVHHREMLKNRVQVTVVKIYLKKQVRTPLFGKKLKFQFLFIPSHSKKTALSLLGKYTSWIVVAVTGQRPSSGLMVKITSQALYHIHGYHRESLDACRKGHSVLDRTDGVVAIYVECSFKETAPLSKGTWTRTVFAPLWFGAVLLCCTMYYVRCALHNCTQG